MAILRRDGNGFQVCDKAVVVSRNFWTDFLDPYEIDDNLAAFFVSLAVVLGICLALVIAVCACCRFDNYLFEVAKRISARCRVS